MNKSAMDQWPSLVFEVSWEICNKVGGIHTVISSKCQEMVEALGDQYLVIGPDIWREEHENPEFNEDPELFRSWKHELKEIGVPVRIGRWNIPGNPLAIIVDFTPLIAKKDEIFSKAWETYKLDSISGQWDYVEAALFGYATGMVIKSFVEYHQYQEAISHFHEWMTGMGVLYLKQEAPYIGTVFTTHATTVGRSLAGNGYPLYESLKDYQGDEMAELLNVKAKQSLEKNAAKLASVFTTVSEITAGECSQFLLREPEVITPNGFFVDSDQHGLNQENLSECRKKLFAIASAVVGFPIKDDHFIVGTGGRYEYHNKGLDLFIESLALLRERKDLSGPVLAFILVPAHSYGPRNSVLSRLNGEQSEISGSPYLTHNLHNAQDDPIIKKLSESGLLNKVDDPVKVIFVPSYLNGGDEIIDFTYYQVLSGLDYSMFPSYYEPWGYTPMESLSFGVPTQTTDLSGFGRWILDKDLDPEGNVIGVINRSGRNRQEVLLQMVEHMMSVHSLSQDKRIYQSSNARDLVANMSWKSFISEYWKAYQLATDNVASEDRPVVERKSHPEEVMKVGLNKASQTIWRNLLVESKLPDSFAGLEEISRNLWWTWNQSAEQLFSSLDDKLWEEVEHNPIKLLRQVSLERLNELESDTLFQSNYEAVLNEYRKYTDFKSSEKGPEIAYFSMEYGFHASLKIYSGGLGILAGDYLKEASDRKVALTGIGLLYKHGYFKQTLTLSGEQIAENIPEEFQNLPLELVKDKDGQELIVQVAFPGRTLKARIWRVRVGRINLFLLDTDHDGNQPTDRVITGNLYGGDEENRLKQEMLLGVGGIRMLDKLGIHPDLYHCNEGHAAFIGLERVRRFMENKKFTFHESLEAVRASTLFTTHTPVPAGHDSFTEDMIRTYMGHYPTRINISWDEFINLGRLNANEPSERFSMSHLAARFSQEINGVSALHGEVSRNMLKNLWPGFYPEELNLGSVTNGVHYHTWTAETWQKLHLDAFGKDFIDHQSDASYWGKIYNVPKRQLWDTKEVLRKSLIDYIKHRLEKVSIRRHELPSQVMETLQKLDEGILTIGFARRFATYKRAHLLFKDLDRLASIVLDENRPVQFIFAGKAHPRDKAGQDLIRHILEISRQPRFRGRIIFLENYDMTVARKLVQGVDVWLNTPTRPLEASGTSGIKAVLNGVLNLSVLDGWWCEGYQPDAGWALAQEKVYQDQEYQDELDAATLYNMIENEVVPLFYKRNAENIPEEWVGMMQNSLAHIAPKFTTRRMIDDYFDRYYSNLYNRTVSMRANRYHLAREISRWKRRISQLWEGIQVVSINYSKDLQQALRMGEICTAEVRLELNGLTADDIGIEIVVISEAADGSQKFVNKQEFKRTVLENGHVTYKLRTIPTQPGLYKFGIRLYAKSDLLPHRQDFNYIRWI